MKVVLLRRAVRDLDWWEKYYTSVFPAGRPNAAQHLDQAISVLADNPLIGRQVADLDLRAYGIARTPFSLFYRVKNDVIEVVRVRDMRKRPDPKFVD